MVNYKTVNCKIRCCEMGCGKLVSGLLQNLLLVYWEMLYSEVGCWFVGIPEQPNKFSITTIYFGSALMYFWA